GVDVGSSYHWMNDVMPAWATSPTELRRAGGMSASQGRVSSRRLMVTVAMSPEIRRSQARVAALSMACFEDVVTGSALAACVPAGARVHVVQRVLLDGLRDERTLDLSVICQSLQRAHHHGRTVDVEEAASRGAGVREAEAVGAQRVVPVGHPRADLVLHRVHEVADRDDRPFGALKLLREVSGAGLLLRVQEVVLVDGQAVVAQLAPRGDRPDIRAHAPVLA